LIVVFQHIIIALHLVDSPQFHVTALNSFSLLMTGNYS
jgi:hypothetical protein